MKFFKTALLAVFCISILSGCSPAADNAKPATNDKVFLTVVDDAGRTVVLRKKPERVISLATSYLNMIDAVGGTIVGRASSKVGEQPESMKNVPEVGFVYNINMETLIGLKPDLVIANKNQHEKFLPLLESNKIPVIAIHSKTYDEVKEKLLLMGEIYGAPEKGAAAAAKIDQEIQTVVKKMPKEEKRIVILHATPSNVTVELEHSIAGCVAQMLGLKNVASGSMAIKGKPEKTPYSMEALVEKNPEIIFITFMGDSEEIENRLRADVKSNPAWASLEAVRNNKVYLLPERLFLLNPGLQYPQAVKYMAQTVYPEVFKDDK